MGDRHGDTRDTATDLALDTYVSSRLEAEDDVDFFKIELAEQGNFTVVCARCAETLTLFDAAGMQLGTAAGAIPEATYAAGVYYGRVGTGPVLQPVRAECRCWEHHRKRQDYSPRYHRRISHLPEG